MDVSFFFFFLVYVICFIYEAYFLLKVDSEYPLPPGRNDSTRKEKEKNFYFWNKSFWRVTSMYNILGIRALETNPWKMQIINFMPIGLEKCLMTWKENFPF